MDNFFQVLIYLIIIIAFLNSIFKKKDKEKPRENSPDRTSRHSSTELKYPQNSPQDDYDILREIEDLFKNKPSSPPERRKFESTIEIANKKKISEDEHTKEQGEHEFDKSWHEISPFKRKVKIDAAIEKEAEQFEHILESLDKEEDSGFKELRTKLYSPQSLKEYMVILEILGKPKYLRR